MKEQDKTSEKELNKMEISNLPDKEFKERCSPKLEEEWMNSSENFTKEAENIKTNQSELKNIITDIKNILEGINCRLEKNGSAIWKTTQ